MYLLLHTKGNTDHTVHFHNNSTSGTLPVIVYLSPGYVLDTCGPVGVGGDLPMFPGGVVVGVLLPPTIISINITELSALVCLVHI